MKQFAFLLLVFTAALSGCKDKIYLKYQANVPVYMSYEAFRSSVKFEAPRSISTKGNIYLKNDFLFVIEPDKGIHFIDNSNPSAPTQTGFLNVMGCSNMTVKGNHLFVNSYIDLVVVDISNLGNPTEVKRIEDIFPQALPAIGNNLRVVPIDKNAGVVISWDVRTVKEETEAQVQPTWVNCPNCLSTMEGGGSPTPVYETNSNGISGSITKFTAVGDYLYLIDGFRLIPVNVSNPLAPVAGTATTITRVAETLFPANGHLFMGTTNGMVIWSVDNPEAPTELSVVEHATACDPVVVQGNYAYVTTRTGTTCWGNINQLDVVDISNLSSPHIVGSFQMTNPHGLGIDGSRLFICDGAAGLKVFDASNPLTCGDHLQQQYQSIQATDVIPFNNIAIVIGDHGIYQYDYASPNLPLLSTIPFN